MKSIVRAKWNWADTLAVGFVTDLLEQAPKGRNVPACAPYIAKNVLRKSRFQLRKAFALHGNGDFFHSAEPVTGKCIAATAQTAVFEVRGGLVRYGIPYSSASMVIAATVFHVRLTFECCSLPGESYVPAPIPRRKRALRPDPQPFPVRAIDFNYENIR
ncbi:MAG: hypothetical protein ACREE6_00675 [Limisphaerales bacterium]